MKWFSKLKAKATPKEVPEVEEYQLKDKELEKLSASFVSPDEKYIASLGNGYIMNYLANKSTKKGFAFITDKRVYFKGSCLSGTGKNLVKTNEERTVDVKSITGSGFTYHKSYGILIALFLSIMVTLGGAIVSSVYSWEKYSDIKYEKRENVGAYKSFLALLNELNGNDIIFVKHGFELSDDVKGEFFRNRIVIDTHYVELEDIAYSVLLEEESLARIEEGNAEELVQVLQNEIPTIESIIAKLNLKYSLLRFLFGALGVVFPILFLPIAILCCISFKNYLFSRKTLFRIEYAGGCIAFNVSFYAKSEIDDFQKQLRRAKDMAEESTAIKSATTESPMDIPTQNSSVDDLRKYAELLKDGLITQEEYDAMKKKVLGL